MSTYVVQGLVYFATHPRLWLLTLCPLVLTLIVGMATAIVLFAVALVPQVEGLEQIGITSWLSWMLAVLLVLVEVFFLTLIYNLVVMGSYQDKIFDTVMVARGFQAIVDDDVNHASCTRSCRSCCRVSLWLRLVLLIVTLPLNLLPIVGSIMYAWLNGTILAWEYHLRYFEFKNFTYAQQKAFINEHKLEYSSFGMQALLMEMIPGLGSLFVFTNAVGSALLAAHLEEDECERTVEKR
ncbi:hypothetical protein Plhal304r1_c034g0107801 [Plasmopara halstedii]